MLISVVCTVERPWLQAGEQTCGTATMLCATAFFLVVYISSRNASAAVEAPIETLQLVGVVYQHDVHCKVSACKIPEQLSTATWCA